MRSDRPDSPRRGDERRMVSRFPRLERLESRDLMALVVGPVSATEDVLFGGTVARLSTSDVQIPITNLNAQILWGDGSAATTGQVVAGPPGELDVIGQKAYGLFGQYPVVVSVTGTNQTPLTAQGVATVAPATLTVNGTKFTTTAGQSFGGVVASYQDASGAGAGGFTATINWGAGQATTVGTISPVPNSTGFYTVSGPYTYAAPGTDNVTVTIVRVANGQSATVSSTATVVPSSLTSSGTLIAPTANAPFTGAVASFVDTDNSTSPAAYNALITWGTGLPKTVGTITAVANMPGHFSVGGTFTYVSPGTEPVSVLITNPATGQSTTASTTAVVAPSLTATGTNLTPTLNVPFTARVASFIDSGPAVDPREFTATINWGSGQSTTVGTVSPDPTTPGGFTVTGSYQYANPSPFTVIVTILRADTGQMASASTSVLVSPSLSVFGTPATATAGVPFSGQVAAFVDGGHSTSPGDFTAMISWGAGLPTTPATITYSSTTGTFNVFGSFIYPSSGEFTPRITVVRVATGQTSSATTTVVVATSLVGSGNPITTTAGESFSGPVATFTDSSSTSTNSGNYSAMINWGDGHVTPGTIAFNSSAMVFALYGSNTYATPGTYPIAVTLVRSVGNQLLTINSSAVVYAFTGGLDPLINTGSPTGIGITNHNQPTLVGTAEPNALVRLFGQKTDGSPTIPLGETVAGSNGLWKMTLLPLADGTYTIVGVGVPTTGSPYPPVLLTTFLVDTVAPRVVGLSYDTSSGKVTVTFQDDRSGLNPASLFNRNNYTLLGPGNTVIPASSVQAGPTVATLPTDPESVVLTFRPNPKNRGGSHRLRIASGGVTDLAGNSLVGGVFGPIPTSKGHPAPSHPAKTASHPTAKPKHRD